MHMLYKGKSRKYQLHHLAIRTSSAALQCVLAVGLADVCIA